MPAHTHSLLLFQAYISYGSTLLRKLASLGKMIVVVTEGPQDAQEWTIFHLGIAPYIDCLGTTNKFGATTGLFSLVLTHLEISRILATT
jgi:putative hydrolase of the HAD superfamily